MKSYESDEKVFLKSNKRLRNKFDIIYLEKVVERDVGITVLIDGKKSIKAISDDIFRCGCCCCSDRILPS